MRRLRRDRCVRTGVPSSAGAQHAATRSVESPLAALTPDAFGGRVVLARPRQGRSHREVEGAAARVRVVGPARSSGCSLRRTRRCCTAFRPAVGTDGSAPSSPRPHTCAGHTATAGHEAMSSIPSSLLAELASAMTDEVEAIVAFDHGDTSTLAAWTREGCPAVHHLLPAMWWLMLGWVSPAR